MNVERLEALAALIETLPHERDVSSGDAFTMSVWRCGTAACIGGWAMVMMGYKGAPSLSQSEEEGMVAEWLGLAAAAAIQLFYPPSGHGWDTYDDIKPAEAVRVIRNLISTGEVYWSWE